MQAARDAVREFMYGTHLVAPYRSLLTSGRIKNGHHDTTVHEVVRPAIFHETISRTEHEIDETVVSREIHQVSSHSSDQAPPIRY